MSDIKRAIGLTGGMGAGKSTLVEVIKAAHIPVYDVDAAVHGLYEDPLILNHVGGLIGIKDPSLTRKDISNEMVQRPYLLPVVEQYMMIHLARDLEQTLAQPHDPFIIIDAPLLFEMGWHKRVDMVIGILCPREIREQRVMGRPGMTREKMSLFMDKQVDEAFRLLNSQYIIHNDKTIEEAQAKMLGIIENLREFYGV
jgi:dephospho-CoA kinase